MIQTKPKETQQSQISVEKKILNSIESELRLLNRINLHFKTEKYLTIKEYTQYKLRISYEQQTTNMA